MKELMVFLPCIAIAVFGVLWIRAGVLLENARDEIDDLRLDLEDMTQECFASWQDYDDACDALDDADKQIAKLRWRLAEQDIPRAGLPAMYLCYAANMRSGGWARQAHAVVIKSCAAKREDAHAAGLGVP